MIYKKSFRGTLFLLGTIGVLSLWIIHSADQGASNKPETSKRQHAKSDAEPYSRVFGDFNKSTETQDKASPTETVLSIHVLSEDTKPTSLRRHQRMAIALGGWKEWLSKVNGGEVDISDLSQFDKTHIIRMAVSHVDAEVIQDFIESGFPVPDSAIYSAMTFDQDDTKRQETIVLKRLNVLEPHINYERAVMAHETTPFDKAVAFGYQEVMRFFARKGIGPSSEKAVFERLVRGRQPSVEIFNYLTSQGHQPPDDFFELARENNIRERAPSLYESISSRSY